MSIVLVAGVWLLLGVVFCLASGRSAGGRTPEAEPTEIVVATAPRHFVAFPVHQWALAAHNIATDELLSTRPGAIRRVPAT